MKTSIINALIVTLAATVKVAEACALYGNCRCTMADGTTNNTITEQACAKYHTEIGLDGTDSTAYTPHVDSDGVTWCTLGRINENQNIVHVDNCSMREYCTAVGATGADSWCKDKTFP
ncbi:hypothetical protein LX32DRAFT_634822 [Colletotrichum zoysiae]|uniref:Uncharacterized protein n=1 Tax=Colletotrichum zoysiae TaxID=1216348 RepID=A0AAD9HRY2_9PEZI|nr:hypothetical protein LX32DRAFT_634822 [Colletotrichum zoysiae]